jgi:Secretion system C-terminal sorting domain
MKQIIFTLWSFLMAALCSPSYGQSWHLVEPINEDYWAYIKRMQVVDNELHLMGKFTHTLIADSTDITAIWDSTILSVVIPTSHFGMLHCRQTYQGDIYYGGDFFNYLGNVQLEGIFRYSNNEFWPLEDGGCNGTEVNDLALYSDRLIVCGSLDDINCVDSIFWGTIAAWDGNHWQAIGTTFAGNALNEMIEFDNKLFVLGYFSFVSLDNDFDYFNNYIDVNNIAYWDGTTWGEPGNGVNDEVYDAVVDTANNRLIIGGLFSNVNGTPMNRVAAWDGSAWEPLGEGLNGFVYALEWYRGQLYAGGYAVKENDPMAYFDGYHWQPLPQTEYSNGGVLDLCTYKGELYVATSFLDEINGLAPNGLIRYSLPADSVVWGVPDDIVEFHAQSNRFTVFPNPAQGKVNIQFNAPFKGDLIVTTTAGTEVHRINHLGENESFIDLSFLPTGTYLLHAMEKGRAVDAQRLVLE